MKSRKEYRILYKLILPKRDTKIVNGKSKGSMAIH